MKIKTDFVTNSSSTSYVIWGKIKYEINDLEWSLEVSHENATTVDIIKLFEGILEHQVKIPINHELKITLSQGIDDIMGDGWDGGDYQVAGSGCKVFGRSDILKEIMTKNDVELNYFNGRINFPSEWITELDPDIVREKYKDRNIDDSE